MPKSIEIRQNTSILFISKLYYPHIGGVEKHLDFLCRELIRGGMSVTILTEQFTKRLNLYEKKDGVEIVRIPVTEKLFLKKFFIWKWILFHPLFLFKFNVIHIHDVFYYVLPFRLLFFFKKVFITFHGYEGYPIKFRWIVARKIAEYLTNGNICVGDFMKKWYFTRPTSVIYGAVSLRSTNSKPKDHSALFFGRLDDQTGILEYIEAYKKIKQKYANFKLTVIGEGPLRNKIPKEVEVIKFKSNVDQYIQANRFIFVSRYLSMLEALSQKREVIAVYDNPIKKDYIYISPFKKYVSVAGTSKEISNIVLRKLKNNQNYEMVEAGYSWAQKLTWKKMAKTYLQLWGY